MTVDRPAVKERDPSFPGLYLLVVACYQEDEVVHFMTIIYKASSYYGKSLPICGPSSNLPSSARLRCHGALPSSRVFPIDYLCIFWARSCGAPILCVLCQSPTAEIDRILGSVPLHGVTLIL